MAQKKNQKIVEFIKEVEIVAKHYNLQTTEIIDIVIAGIEDIKRFLLNTKLIDNILFNSINRMEEAYACEMKKKLRRKKFFR